MDARAAASVLFYADLASSFDPADLDAKPLGGSENALVHVATELAALGHRVIVVGHPGTEAVTSRGVEYFDVKSIYWRSKAVDVSVVYRQLPHVWRKLPGRLRLLWAQDHIGIFPELVPGPRRWLFNEAWQFGHRIFGSSLAGIVAASRWLGDCFVRYARWPREGVWIIPNGIDATRYPDPNPAELRSDPNRPLRVAYTSRPERGLVLLLTRIMPEIWKVLPNVELHVTGYRPLDAYRGLPGASDSRVHFRGRLRQADLARELQHFDLWVYPTDFPETSCIAAMEAQAAGLPAITSSRYALRETVLDGRTGILIDGAVGSTAYVEEFAAAAVTLLSDPARRTVMGENARAWILTHFTWDRVAAAWEALLTRLVGPS